MKGWLLALRPLTRWSVVALLAGAVGCGKGLRADVDAAVGGDDGPIDAATSADLDTGTADSSSEAMYSGVVLAMITHDEVTTSCVSRAVFTTGPRPAIGGCPRCCCGVEERGLPYPVKPPDAGRITIAAAAGATTLATLVPWAFVDGYGKFYGMSDLGWSWFSPLSDYGPVDSQPWSPGDALRVVAAGNEVESFSGALQTGAPLAGIMPPIGPSPVVLDRSQDFEVSWTPEGKGDATVLLSLPRSGSICYCDAPDSAGRLVVDANLLSPLSVEQNGKIKLARLTISTVASGNATIDLVGAVIQEGPLVVQ
ncbi:MAG TPA: hypothetical protein VJ801_08555 [Polyangia bacterium]|nr:hypothetical protein [Polyangia bacterium]